jgi:hypothetical protein
MWFSLLALQPTIGTLPLSSVFFPRGTWGIYGDSTSMIGSKSFSFFLGPLGPSIFCTIFAGETSHFGSFEVWNLLLNRPYMDGGGEVSGRVAKEGPSWNGDGFGRDALSEVIQSWHFIHLFWDFKMIETD